MTWYVWKHMDDEIAGTEVDGTFYPDTGCYTVFGQHAMLYDEAALGYMHWDANGPHVREATEDEIATGAKPVWGGPPNKRRIIDFVPDGGFPDGVGPVTVVYKDGSRRLTTQPERARHE